MENRRQQQQQLINAHNVNGGINQRPAKATKARQGLQTEMQKVWQFVTRYTYVMLMRMLVCCELRDIIQFHDVFVR